MSVMRVGFVLGQVGWLGGVNYFRNLLSAIDALPGIKIHPVVFVGMKSDSSAFEGLAEIVRTPMLDRYAPQWCVRKVFGRIFPARDYFLYSLLKKNNIDLLSHFETLWKGAGIPSLGWIPDFQHVYYPQFFSKKEWADRDVQFMNITERCSALLLSSEDARNDLRKFNPASDSPAFVLRFVSSLHPNINELPSREELMAKYKLGRNWFHIPNQFWAHKNHGVVLDALGLLKQRGLTPLVVSTGKKSDYRNEEYFPSFMKRVLDEGLQDDFVALGIVPYSDVVALMLYSIAIINPSLFEGWSTSVEESKAMGKRVLLSDLPVHREQAPERGAYFGAHDGAALAEHMETVMREYDEESEKAFLAGAQIKQDATRQAFAAQFETICLEVINGK